MSKVDKYFTDLLEKEKLSKNFEEDSENGYIKVGNFLVREKKNAIIISFDTITSFKVYELNDNEWKEIFKQDETNFKRINQLKAYIEDYNFDGINDIGIRNEVSNGTAIMTFHLWITGSKSFKYIPEFEDIGNPLIIKKSNTIQGFKACCKFTEMTLCNYNWNEDKLIKITELEIGNFPYGIEAKLKNIAKKNETEIELSENEISKIIEKYSENWQINDTTANSG